MALDLDKVIAEAETRVRPEFADHQEMRSLAALRSARAHERIAVAAESLARGSDVWNPLRDMLNVPAHEPESVLAAAILKHIEHAKAIDVSSDAAFHSRAADATSQYERAVAAEGRIAAMNHAIAAWDASEKAWLAACAASTPDAERSQLFERYLGAETKLRELAHATNLATATAEGELR